MGCVAKGMKEQKIVIMCERNGLEVPQMDTMSSLQLSALQKVIDFSTRCGDTDRLETAITRVREAVGGSDEEVELSLASAEEWVARSSFDELVRMFQQLRDRLPEQENVMEKRWLQPDRALNWNSPEVVVHNMLCHYLQEKGKKVLPGVEDVPGFCALKQTM